MNLDESIVYYRTPKRTPIFRMLALGFFLLGVWLVLGGEGVLIEAVAVVSFLCFGVCAWLSGRRWKRRHRVYAINHDGFSLVGPDGKEALFCAWKEVQGVGISDLGYGKSLTFAFVDPDDVKSRMIPAHRARAEDNESVGLPTLTIPQNQLDLPVDDVRTASGRFFFAAG